MPSISHNEVSIVREKKGIHVDGNLKQGKAKTGTPEKC